MIEVEMQVRASGWQGLGDTASSADAPRSKKCFSALSMSAWQGKPGAPPRIS
jgi:hypothetical protein